MHHYKKYPQNSVLDVFLLFVVKKKTSKRNSKAGHRPDLGYTDTKRSDIYTKTAKL